MAWSPKGRPAKLTPAIQKAIAKAVASGVTIGRAAELVGVKSATVFEWLQRGEGRAERPTTPIYAEFADAIKNARAQDERRRVKRIDEAAAGGFVVYEKTMRFPDGRTLTEVRRTAPEWQADAWHLERSRPEDWGRKDRVDVHHFVAEEVERIAKDVELSAEEKQALISDVEAFAYGRS